MSSAFFTFQKFEKNAREARMIKPFSSITRICSSDEVKIAFKSEFRLLVISSSFIVSSNTSWKIKECTSPVTLPSSFVTSRSFFGGYNLKYTYFSFLFGFFFFLEVYSILFCSCYAFFIYYLFFSSHIIIYIFF